jgi:quinol-cytochrome oxidoreductase complex cytochrome b subunit
MTRALAYEFETNSPNGAPPNERLRLRSTGPDWSLEMRLLQSRVGQILVWIAFFDLFVLFGTGVFLTYFYTPDATQAYDNIQSLHTSIAFGLLFRNLHRWSGAVFYVAIIVMLTFGIFGLVSRAKWSLRTVGAVLATVLIPPLLFVTISERAAYVLWGTKEINGGTLLRWFFVHPLGVVPAAFAVFGLWQMRGALSNSRVEPEPPPSI